MAGGGEGAFIGAVHRMAARLDGEWDLVCGAFSIDAGRNARTGASLGLDPDRTYDRFEAMIAAEAVGTGSRVFWGGGSGGKPRSPPTAGCRRW
jgi:predicted dehydrogenase